MKVRTILNYIHKVPGFVYGRIRLVENDPRDGRVAVEVRPRAGSRPGCSVCGMPGPGYDRLHTCRFQFVPLFGLPVYFLYAMRRVNCSRCGKVKVERVPWADGQRPVTKAFSWPLAGWAKRLSWQETAQVCGVSWDRVRRSVCMAVAWGRARVDLSAVKTLGVDEIAWHKGHQHLTLVYWVDRGCRRLLWIGEHRRIKSLAAFFDWSGQLRSSQLPVVCSDMWKAYLSVTRKRAPNAVRVLDRFHILQKLSKAIDKVRAGEARKLKAAGSEPLVKNARRLLLQWCRNLSEQPIPRL